MTTALADAQKSAPAADSPYLVGVHASFGELAKALASHLTVLIVELQEKSSSPRTVARKVQQFVPKFFEQEFEARFLADADGARRQRALLVHLLSSCELQNACRQGDKGAQATTAPEPWGFAVDADAAEITSEEAASLLHVSRTHVNTLVASGALGTLRLTPGGHRRLSRSGVLRYKEQSKARQSRGLDRMSEASERLGLYDQESADAPNRRKK